MVRRVLLRLAGPVLLLTAGLSCDPKETGYFLTTENTRPIGDITGLVAVGTTPINGANVALTGPESRTTTTGTTGIYTFLDLVPGNYTVTPTVPGFNCPAGNATVIEFQTTTLNLVCTPQVGAIDGTIRLDLTVQSGIPVAARQGTNTVGSATTGANGKYTIPNLLPGAYTVAMTPPANAVCPTTQRDVTVQSNQTTTADFDCTSAPGSVTGTVRVDLVGRAGVTVTLMQGTTTVGTATTGAGGTYTIANVQPGAYTATITPPSSTVCPTTSQNVTVQSNQAATANFDCTTAPGSVTGTVNVDMVGRSGVTVTLTQGTTTIGTATTGAGGTYTISNLQPGTYTVAITPPAGTVCTSPQDVTVQSSQAATANFTCTTPPSDFTVNLADPPPSYRHIVAGVSSETCTGVTTNPAKPGGSWTTMWTGPGTVGATQRSGTLDATGKAVDRQPIDQLGTYNVNVMVTAGGLTRSGTGTVDVQAAAGTCPP